MLHPVISASAAPAISNFFVIFFIDLLIIPYQPAKLVKVLYFGYGIYTAACHDVSYVKTSILIMFPTLAEESHDRRRKPGRHKCHQIDRIRISPYQSVQNIIVPRQGLHHPSFESPSVLCAVIIMLGPALIRTELLVCTAILYLIPAFQTKRHMPLEFLVFHACITLKPIFDKYHLIDIFIKGVN